MRRKADALIPLEVAICEAALELRRRGVDAFHGYAIAKFIKDATEARRFVAQGTLYRALERLERRGLLTSQWEPLESAIPENRPPRRLYALTDAGKQACLAARASVDLRPQLRLLWRAL